MQKGLSKGILSAIMHNCMNDDRGAEKMNDREPAGCELFGGNFAELYIQACLYGGYMVNSHITVCQQMAGALFLYD